MATRSGSVGSGMVTWRSNRPGRRRAGSSTSGRLVAASTTIPVAGSKPSISASSWLRVCSRSSFEPRPPSPPRRWPMASISSMKMMAGACCGPPGRGRGPGPRRPPTNISTKLEPVTREERHPGLPGHGPGQQGLAGARRPDHQDAPRGHGAGPRVPLGLLEEVDHLADLDLGPLVAGHVGEGRLRALLVEDLGVGASDPERSLHPSHRPLGEAPPQVAEHEEWEEQEHPGEDLGAERGARGVSAVTWMSAFWSWARNASPAWDGITVV